MEKDLKNSEMFWNESGDPDGIRTHDLHRDRVAC